MRWRCLVLHAVTQRLNSVRLHKERVCVYPHFYWVLPWQLWLRTGTNWEWAATSCSLPRLSHSSDSRFWHGTWATTLRVCTGKHAGLRVCKMANLRTCLAAEAKEEDVVPLLSLPVRCFTSILHIRWCHVNKSQTTTTSGGGRGNLDFSTNIYVVTLSGHLINTCLRANLQEWTPPHRRAAAEATITDRSSLCQLLILLHSMHSCFAVSRHPDKICTCECT